MGEIVNLRRARKSKKRAEDARAADANRIAFGRTRTEREVSEKEKSLAARRLDGHMLPPDDQSK
jgi:hypothetical protein